MHVWLHVHVQNAPSNASVHAHPSAMLHGQLATHSHTEIGNNIAQLHAHSSAMLHAQLDRHSHTYIDNNMHSSMHNNTQYVIQTGIHWTINNSVI